MKHLVCTALFAFALPATAMAQQSFCGTLNQLMPLARADFAAVRGAQTRDHVFATTVNLPGARSCEILAYPDHYFHDEYQCDIPFAAHGGPQAMRSMARQLQQCLGGIAPSDPHEATEPGGLWSTLYADVGADHVYVGVDGFIGPKSMGTLALGEDDFITVSIHGARR